MCFACTAGFFFSPDGWTSEAHHVLIKAVYFCDGSFNVPCQQSEPALEYITLQNKACGFARTTLWGECNVVLLFWRVLTLYKGFFLQIICCRSSKCKEYARLNSVGLNINKCCASLALMFLFYRLIIYLKCDCHVTDLTPERSGVGT